MINSTELINWFKVLSYNLKKGKIVKLHMSDRVKRIYHTLTWSGELGEFLMIREQKNGLCHLVKVR